MLPDGFYWQPHMEWQALRLDGRTIATYSERPGAVFVLAYLHCGTDRYTGKTYSSEASARTYIEAWARRWHVELREVYGQPADRAHGTNQVDVILGVAAKSVPILQGDSVQ